MNLRWNGIELETGTQMNLIWHMIKFILYKYYRKAAVMKKYILL